MSENPRMEELQDVFTNMKSSAGLLVEMLDSGDYNGAREMIININEERDQNIYREVGRLTRAIHESINEFNVDLAKHGIAESDEDGATIVNAKDRLDHVIKITDDAANTTMDMVEEGIPISDALSKEAIELREKWGKLIRREMNPDEFRELYKAYRSFLGNNQQLCW